ncbi:hypothetical protein IAT40_003007 [Kwoniella sp. CBS 6097]
MAADHVKKEHKPATGVHSAGSSNTKNSSGKKPGKGLSKKAKAKNRRRGAQKAIKTKAKNKRRLERDREQADVVRQINPDYEGPFERKARLRKEFLARRREINKKFEERVAAEEERQRKRRLKKNAIKGSQAGGQIANDDTGPSVLHPGQTVEHPIKIDMDEEEERIEHGPRPPTNPDIMIPYVPLSAARPSAAQSAAPSASANASSGVNLGNGSVGQAQAPVQRDGSQSQDSTSVLDQAGAGPSTPTIYHVNYPMGGVTSKNKKKGIFADPEKDKKLRFWVDPLLRDRTSMIQKIKGEYGRISADHSEKATQLIILSPRSTYLFDMYCHPDWLPAADRERFRRRQRKLNRMNEEEPWQRKVLLKDTWVARCIDAGRFLGAADDWGGCRAGGPPVGVMTSARVLEGADADGNDEDEEEDYWTEEDEDSEDEDEEMFSDEELPDEEDQSVGEEEAPIAEPAEELPVKSEIARQARHLLTEITQETSPTEGAQLDSTVDTHYIAIDGTHTADSHSANQAAAGRQSSLIPALSKLDVAVFNEPTGLQTPDTGLATPAPLQGGSVPPQAMSDQDQDQHEDFQAMSDDPRVVELEEDDPEYAAQGIADEDAAMEEVDPKTMFQGLKFWLDPAYPDRLPLIRRLRSAGADLSTDYTESTHVLVHGYKANLWHGIVTNLAPRGIWFVTVSWVTKSLDAGRKLPEESYVVLGGNAQVAMAEKEKKPHIHKPGIMGLYEAYMSPEDLAGIFEREINMLEHGGTLRAMCAFLVSKYGTYSEGYWHTLYLRWTKREERFAHMPSASKRRRVSRDQSTESRSSIISSTLASTSTNKLSTDIVRKAIEAAVEANPQMPKPDLCKLLREEHPEYTTGDWSRNIGYWMNRSSRFSSLPPHSPLIRSAKVFEASSVSAAQTPALAAPQPKKGPAYSTEELNEIFSEVVPAIKEAGIKSYTEIGKRLGSKYPGLHSSTWSILYSEWVRKTGQFWSAHTDPAVSNCPQASSASASEHDGTAVGLNLRDEHMSTEDLAFTFLLHEDAFVNQEMDTASIGCKLATLYAGNSAHLWGELWTAWAEGKDRFANIETGARPKRAQSQANSLKRNKASRSMASSSASQGSSSRSSVISKAETELLNTEEIALICKEREQTYSEERLTRPAIGVRLAEDVGIYTAGTWGNYYNEWFRGLGRFAPLDHSLRSIPAGGYPPISIQSNHIERSTGRINLKDLPSAHHSQRFTMEEERDMAQFIAVHPGPYKKTAIAWFDFADKQPSRTAYAWAQHYSAYQFRIDSYAKPPQSGMLTASASPAPIATLRSARPAVRIARPTRTVASSARPIRPVRAVRGSQEMPVKVDSDSDATDEEELNDIDDWNDSTDQTYIP